MIRTSDPSIGSIRVAPLKTEDSNFTEVLLGKRKATRCGGRADSICQASPSIPTCYIDPHTFFLKLLREKGYDVCEVSVASLPKDFFLDVTEERIASYDIEVITAIRKRNITLLRQLYENGKSMQASNKFGESLLHMACRRGFTDVVQFLLEEAKVSLRVKDDYGRTPYHDACWLPSANFDLIELLISHDTDMLLVKDARGFPPMAYARKSDWNAWIRFLEENKSRIELKTFQKSSSFLSACCSDQVTE